MILSMTGFASRTFQVGEDSYKIEVKSLNHRFLDLKVRVPRDFAPFEANLRGWIEARIKRGAIDLWIERQSASKTVSEVRIDEDRIRSAHRVLERLRTELGIREEVGMRDLLAFPEVFSKAAADERSATDEELLRKELHLVTGLLLDDLIAMRSSEGIRLRDALLAIVDGFKETHGRLLARREVIRNRAAEKIRKRIELCFEAWPSADDRLRALMESRIAQEIAHSLEKLDVEEELTRLHGHIVSVERILKEGGAVGKKLDFMFQELNREVNTLSNKSQDLDISSEAIGLKIGIEQLREQSLNLE